MITIPWVGPARRLLTDHILQLRTALATLARGLRRRLAAAIGEAVIAICDIILEPSSRPSPTHYPGRNDRDPFWDGDPTRDPWADDYDSLDNEELPEPTDASKKLPQRWRSALAMALEATVSWLRRQPVRLSAVTALAAAAAAWAGAPVLVALAGLTSAGLGLIRLADQASTSANELAGAIQP